jgi:hypothetical protein
MRIRLSQISAIAVRRLKRLPHFPAPQMNQIKGMVTLALIAAHEIFLQNGLAFVVYFSVLVAGWVVAAIRAPLFGHQYLTLLLPVLRRTHNCCATQPK